MDASIVFSFHCASGKISPRAAAVLYSDSHNKTILDIQYSLFSSFVVVAKWNGFSWTWTQSSNRRIIVGVFHEHLLHRRRLFGGIQYQSTVLYGFGPYIFRLVMGNRMGGESKPRRGFIRKYKCDIWNGLQ